MDQRVIQQEVIQLWDDYRHVHFDRRLFLERLAKLAGGSAAAMALLPLLENNYAQAAQVSETDKRVKATHLTYPGASGDIKAYLAETTKPGKHGGVLVVHQNRGLNPHIEDVARRLAVAGYDALAPDFLSPLGGTPADDDAATKMFNGLDINQVNANAIAGVKWLKARPEVNGKVGAVGFCWGGDEINRLAVSDPDMAVSVVYYGAPPPLNLVPKITMPLLLNYADPKLDTRLGGLFPAYEAALKADHKNFKLYAYAGANHAFNDDTQAARYDEKAAKLAWRRTLAYFKRYLA